MTRLMGQEKQRISERIERLNAERRATAGGRSLVISLGMAGSIEFGEKRCGSVVTPAGSPT